jgi:hypothetical protein
MGRDIHWFVERYDDDEQIWELIDGTIPVQGEYKSALIYNCRNYSVFETLVGGINSSIKPRYPIRGLPDDCNPITKACSNVEGEYVTQHTWLTIEELGSLNIDDKIFRDVINEKKKISYEFPVRVVFWFDK